MVRVTSVETGLTATTRPARQLLLAILGTAAAVAGCQPGVAWRLGRFEDGFAEAKAANRLTFVYFRNWYSVECTTFEEQVLRRPEVLQATAEMVCIPLEYDVDRALAEKWGIQRVPAFAIVGPAGEVLETGSGAISAEELLQAIRRARERMAAQQQPAKGS